MSAYIDGEVTPEEKQAIDAHLDACPSCRLEQEALSCTKKLVASLATRTPRQELENLLSIEAQRLENPTLRDRVTVLLEELGYALRTPLLPKPLVVTAALSLAGLWLATTTLDGPRDWDINRAVLNAVPPSDLPQATILVFSQSPGEPPVFTGVPGAQTVSLPVSQAQIGVLPASLTAPHDGWRVGKVNGHSVLIRAAAPRPTEWQPVQWNSAESLAVPTSSR